MPEEVVDVETPEVPAAPAEEQGESSSESATDENAPTPEADKQTAIQKRIDKLTKQKNDAAREAEYWRTQALKQPEKPAAQPESAKSEGKPKEDDFATAAEFVEALADWKYAERAKVEAAERQKKQQEETQAELQKRINSDLKTFKAATPDFDDVMEESTFNTSSLLVAEMRESESPSALLYHFAKHPEDANRIAELTDPRKVAKEVGKIEARITSAPAKKQEPITSAPPPIKPVAASRAAVAKLNEIQDDAEYFRQRRAQRK